MNDFLDRVQLSPVQTVEEVPTQRRPSLINQLMMGAEAWMLLADQFIPGLTPEQGQLVYRWRVQRATEYRERAEHIRHWIARAKAFRDNPDVPINDMSGPVVCSILEIICGP